MLRANLRRTRFMDASCSDLILPVAMAVFSSLAITIDDE